MDGPCFQPGGTLRRDAFYIERAADRDLVRALLAGEWCYVLAPRQIGKSSLRARTQAALVAAGAICATVDLTELGRVGAGGSEADWYLSFLGEVGDQLGLPDLCAGWGERLSKSAVYRFTRLLRDGVLAAVSGPVVLFIDELDALRGAGIGHQEFLAALRGIYNKRADEPVWERLRLCLLGVATPGELIDDSQRTPFNVGRAVPLLDFSLTEAEGFLPGLMAAGNGTAGARALLLAVYGWTDGHPYLMQRLCAELAEEGPRDGEPAARVDALVARVFNSPQADTNLSYAERRFVDALAEATMPQKVSVYRRLLLGEEVAADRQSRLHSELRLAGLIKDGELNRRPVLRVRNRIFSKIFDMEWVNRHSRNARLSDALVRWKDGDRAAEGLLRGRELEQALAEMVAQDVEPDLADYLRASQEAQTAAEAEARALATARARLRRQHQLVLLGAVLLVAVLVAETWDLYSYAERAKAHARLLRLGDVARDRDQLDLAQRYYHRMLLLNESWAKAKPDSSQAQHNLSVSLTRLGDVARDRGQMAQAQGVFERALRISERRAQISPGDAEAQRNVLAEHLLLVGLHVHSGAGAKARAQLNAAEAVLQRIHAQGMLAGDKDLTGNEAWLNDLRQKAARLP